MVKPRKAPLVYRLRVELDGIRPAIWRELLVPADRTLAQFHPILQAALGWEDYHLYLFRIGHATYGDPVAWKGEPDVESSRKRKLSKALPEVGARFHYEYDMGDSWQHTVELLEVLPANTPGPFPRCTGGARAAPLEDCGGVEGYHDLVRAVKQPRNKADRETRSGAGAWDPESFSLEATNARLAGRGAPFDPRAPAALRPAVRGHSPQDPGDEA